MNDKTRDKQRIEVAIHWEEEAYQKALDDNDLAELDRINHRARHLIAYCAAHGWRANALLLREPDNLGNRNPASESPEP